MIKKLRQGMLVALTGLLLGAPALIPSPASAQIDDATRQAACEAIGSAGGECGSGQADGPVNSLISSIVNILSWVVGVIAVVMLIIGGFRFVLSNGDSNATKSARDTIIYALVGLLVALFSQAMVRFVLNRASTPPAEEEQSSIISEITA